MMEVDVKELGDIPCFDSDLAFFQSMPIFGGVNVQALKCLLAEAPVVCYPCGQRFFVEGEPGSSIFALLRGGAVAVKANPNCDYMLRHYGVGDCFGEIAALDLFPRSNTCIATQDSMVIKFNQQDFLRLYQCDIEQFALIQMNLARELSRRLRGLQGLVFDVLLDGNKAEWPEDLDLEPYDMV